MPGASNVTPFRSALAQRHLLVSAKLGGHSRFIVVKRATTWQEFHRQLVSFYPYLGQRICIELRGRGKDLWVTNASMNQWGTGITVGNEDEWKMFWKMVLDTTEDGEAVHVAVDNEAMIIED